MHHCVALRKHKHPERDRPCVSWLWMAKKNPHAVALGKLGGKAKAELPPEQVSEINRAGGIARAQKLTKAQRSAIAKKAATARWNKKGAT
jgi:hypothetical protein